MTEDYAKVIYFLLWAEQHDNKMLFGGYTISEVIDSLAALMDVQPDHLRQLI